MRSRIVLLIVHRLVDGRYTALGTVATVPYRRRDVLIDHEVGHVVNIEFFGGLVLDIEDFPVVFTVVMKYMSDDAFEYARWWLGVVVTVFACEEHSGESFSPESGWMAV